MFSYFLKSFSLFFLFFSGVHAGVFDFFSGSKYKNFLVRGYNQSPKEDIEILDFNPYQGSYSLSTNMGPSNPLSKEEKKYIQSSKKLAILGGLEFDGKLKETPVKQKKYKSEEIKISNKKNVTSLKNKPKKSNPPLATPKTPHLEVQPKKTVLNEKNSKENSHKENPPIKISKSSSKNLFNMYLPDLSEMKIFDQLEKKASTKNSSKHLSSHDIKNEQNFSSDSSNDQDIHKKASFVTDTVDLVKEWINKVPGVNVFSSIPKKGDKKIFNKKDFEKAKVSLSSAFFSRSFAPMDFKKMLDKGHIQKVLDAKIEATNYHGRYYKGIAHYVRSLRRSDAPDVRYRHARSAQKYLRDLTKERGCPEDIQIRSRLWFGIVTYRCFHSPRDVKEGLSSLKKVFYHTDTNYCNDAYFYAMLTYAKIGNKKNALHALHQIQRISKKSDLIYDEDYKIWSSHDSVYKFYLKYLENL